MSLDAILIADFGQHSLSGSSPLRLQLDGRTADIQVVKNYLKNEGKIVSPIEGDGVMSWSSAPKLNGISLISHLTKHNFEVELIDNYSHERNIFCSYLKSNPRAVIISTTFIYRKADLRELVDDIRSLAPDIFVIVGGPFVHLSYMIFSRSHEQIYKTPAIKDDFLFFNRGEPAVDLFIITLRGESILVEALKRIKRNRQTADLPNSATLIGNKYHFTQQIDDVSNAGETSIDWNSLPDGIFKSGVVPVQASTGCPYKCAFCNFTKDRRLLSVKPLEELITELKAMSNRGVKYVWFADDNFRLGKGDLSSVCEHFVCEGLDVQWMSYIRASTLINIDAELLRRSGCIEVQLGLESADQQILSNMNKQASPSMYAQVIQKLLSVGINCTCYFIFGFPGETNDTALRTLEFMKDIEHPELDGILSWSIFPFMLSPLSPIYETEMRKKFGLSGNTHSWTHRTMNSTQARNHVRKAFFTLEGSGPVYRGDNQNSLQKLTPTQRKQFVIKRHHLSKLAIQNRLEKRAVVRSFSEVFSSQTLTRRDSDKPRNIDNFMEVTGNTASS